MGAISTVKTENGKISCETPEGTVINININQRSALDCMLDTIKAIRIKKDVIHKPDREPEACSALPLGVGVSFISVGFLCVVLAVIIAVAQPRLFMFYTGTHFWVGFPFIVSGILNIVAYKHPKPLWMVIAFISLLGCLAVSIAGLVFAVNDISWFSWWSDQCDSLVRSLRNPDRYNSYYRTEPPRYYDNYSYNYELDECKRAMSQYKKMLFGVIILSMLIMIWGICASVITVGCRLKAVFTACKCEKPEEEDNDEPLLSANPPSDVFIA